MAEDVAALLGQLGISRADVFGFSMGGMTALRLAVRHPDLVRKLVVTSAPYSNEGYDPAIVAGWRDMSPEAFAGSPMERAHAQTAPSCCFRSSRRSSTRPCPSRSWPRPL